MYNMRKNIWVWLCGNASNVFLASLFVTTFTFVAVLAYQKYYLFQAHPLENLKAAMHHDPVVLGEDKIFELVGTFDRGVVCEIIDFKMYL